MNTSAISRLLHLTAPPSLANAWVICFIGWVLFLAYSIAHCQLYTNYVIAEPRTFWGSCVWAIQEYFPWPLITPFLLMAYNKLWAQTKWLLMILMTFGAVLISLAARLALDLYLNPEANVITSAVYFYSTHATSAVFVAFGWVLFIRPKEKDIRTNEPAALPPELGPPTHPPKLHGEPSVNSDATIAALTGNETVNVRINAIEYACAAGNYVELHCETKHGTQQSYLLRSTMKDLEAKLSSHQFTRIHRSFLINPTAIVKIKGDEELVLKSGASLSISQRYRNNINNIQ